MRDYGHIKREMDFSLYTDILSNKTKEDIREAYKIVFADMMNNGCGLLSENTMHEMEVINSCMAL